MRNFKKFLALVLAMLMVSACAVSVSAAYADQAAIDATDYAEAVAMLTELGVVKGDGENFNPNNTLRRDEAAVMAAKLVAGAKGQTYDWTAATCQFPDVDAAWSFAYINYVGQRNIMNGAGDGNFNPTGTLRIDEAIAIAVKATSQAAAQTATENTATYKPAYWATYWIAAAESLNLLDNVNAFDFTAACPKAMFAQIAYNVYNNANIKANFGYYDIEADLAVADGVVTLTNVDALAPVETKIVKITEAAFNEALAAAGYTATAADLTDSKIGFTWFASTKKIVSVKVLTTSTAVDYSMGVIKNVYDKVDNADVLNTKTIEVSGIKYTVGVPDAKGTTDIIGGTATDVRGIALTIDGETVAANEVETLPTYFNAVAYDDDNDGDYERLVIKSYVLKTLTKTTVEGVDNYFVDGALINKDAKTAVTFTGKAYAVDGELPALVRTTAGSGAVDVLEVAAAVTGKLTAISTTGNYVTVAGNQYKNFFDTTIVVDAKTLNQTVSIYTVAGKFVKVVNASFSDVVVIVDKAIVNAAGNAVLYGFDATTYAAVEVELTGAKISGKYYTKGAHYAANANDTDSKKYDKLVVLGGTQKSDGSWNDDGIVTFEEGAYYKLNKSADGLYFEEIVLGKSLNTAAADALVANGKLKVDANYVYVGGKATYYNNKAVIMIEVDPADAEAAKHAYATTYKVVDSFAEMTGVTANATIADAKVSFIYITNDGTPDVVVTTAKKIADNQTIVQILGTFVEAAYDHYVYEVVDLLAGTKTTVKATSGDYVGGEYCLVADGAVVEVTTDKWMRLKTITNAPIETGSLITKITAYPTISTKTGDAAPVYSYGEKAEYGIDQITVYQAGADGIIDIENGAPKTTAAGDVIKGTVSGYYAYIVEGKIILVK